MKYFTPELYQQFNSFDVDEAERADEALSDHTHTREAPEGWRFSKLQEQWLYDELDLMNDHRGPFVHRILLSTGITLEIPFMSVVIHRFTMPAVTKLAQQMA